MLDFLRVDVDIFFEIWMEKTFISSERFEEFWVTWKKMWPMIILKATKKQGFTLSF